MHFFALAAPDSTAQAVAESNVRIEQSVDEARRAAEQSNASFDVAHALVNISQVAAVQQGALAQQVALVAGRVAENPDVEDAAVRKDIDGLTTVSGLFAVLTVLEYL